MELLPLGAYIHLPGSSDPLCLGKLEEPPEKHFKNIGTPLTPGAEPISEAHSPPQRERHRHVRRAQAQHPHGSQGGRGAQAQNPPRGTPALLGAQAQSVAEASGKAEKWPGLAQLRGLFAGGAWRWLGR